MIMMDQSRRLSEPLRWTRAGRLAVAAAAVCLLLALGAWAVFGLGGDTRGGAREGCIDVTFPSTLGAGNLHACGTRARSICAAPGAEVAASIGGPLQASCQHAGYRYAARAAGA
jgi:hypothetical protein